MGTEERAVKRVSLGHGTCLPGGLKGGRRRKKKKRRRFLNRS